MSDDSVRLIVVDDLEGAAATLALMLELDGKQVRTAHDGAQALAVIDSFQRHCMLFDSDMPGIDGLELSKLVRERHDNNTVLIAVTARPPHDSRVAGAFRVADHCVNKPVDPRLLRKVLPPLRAASKLTP